MLVSNGVVTVGQDCARNRSVFSPRLSMQGQEEVKSSVSARLLSDFRVLASETTSIRASSL